MSYLVPNQISAEIRQNKFSIWTDLRQRPLGDNPGHYVMFVLWILNMRNSNEINSV